MIRNIQLNNTRKVNNKYDILKQRGTEMYYLLQVDSITYEVYWVDTDNKGLRNGNFSPAKTIRFEDVQYDQLIRVHNSEITSNFRGQSVQARNISGVLKEFYACSHKELQLPQVEEQW